MKAILMSIQPKWCELIANGTKAIEVRKTAPKEVPFKVYMYETKSKQIEYLEEFSVGYCGRGKVIGEFICNKVDAYRFSNYEAQYDVTHEEMSQMCLNHPELIAYGKGKPLYGLHISELKIYDKPKKLSEFKAYNRNCYFSDLGFAKPDCKKCYECNLTRAPKSWQYI